MSQGYQRKRSTSSYDIPWLKVWIIAAIILTIILARYVANNNAIDTTRPSLMVSPETPASTVFISMSESSKNRITGTWWQPLYVWDKSVSIETGNAHISSNSLFIDLDEKTELSYIAHSDTWDVLKLFKWRIWAKQLSSNQEIRLKNLSITLKGWDIAMVEQNNNQIYSTVYAMQGDITITTSVGSYTLHAGNRIMVSGSDLSNPWLQLSSLVDTIDEGIQQNRLFVRNNWKSLLINTQWTSTWTSALVNTNTGSESTWNTLITILEPKNGSSIESTSTIIRGTINSKDIKRVTINNQETIVSPVNKTFIIENFPISFKMNDLVYKAYNTDGKQVESGVITVYWSKQSTQSGAKLIPNTSPISSKDFRIISPASNPFITTDSFIKVQWVVPKNTVSYITVNDFRLQKYQANSPVWYYFANMANDTMKDGINSYTIKFYNSNDEVLYTQLFNIIKESKNVILSGEASR